MFQPVSSFSGFSVDDQAKAQEFYAGTLGLTVKDNGMGLQVSLPGTDSTVFVYAKGKEHAPATFTVLNFVVTDINAAVDELVRRGVTFDTYAMPGNQDERGIMRGKAANMGPDIAWFKDPAGNVLSILED